jgi:ATP-dependent DNA helicase RecQ
LAFYAYKDIEKLEKFMSSKPVAEQEIGHALLQEVVGYAETSMNRRKYLLHYFGEEFDDVNGDGADMDDNSRNPKKKHEAKENVVILLKVVKDTLQKYKAKEVVNTIVGKENALLTSHKTHLQSFFGIGKDKPAAYWMALIRQVLVVNFIKKEIEQYGVVKLTDVGQKYIDKPTSFMMTEDHSYYENDDNSIITNSKSAGGVADEKLIKLLKDLRKKVAVKLGVPPFAVFQDPSLDDMSLKYPITIQELATVHGVGEGKARKFGKDFVKLISNYVEENDILRPDDLIVKSTGVNSSLKLFIIQNTDKKLPLEDISKSKGLEMSELIREMELIIFSGTKINIDYAIDDLIDEDQQEDIHEYFMEAETDDIEAALEEFDGDFDEEELRLMRIKFINEVGN